VIVPDTGMVIVGLLLGAAVVCLPPCGLAAVVVPPPLDVEVPPSGRELPPPPLVVGEADVALAAAVGSVGLEPQPASKVAARAVAAIAPTRA